MDAMIVVRGRARVLPPAARSARGRSGRGRACAASASMPESKERDRLAFAFMSNGISSERQVETAVRQTAALVRHAIEQKQKVVVVAGPVVVHTGGVAGLLALIRGGWVQACSAAMRSACTMSRRRCSAPRSACACPTAGRKSTGIAITCAPSTRSITRARVKQAVECGRLTARHPVRVREGQRAVRAGRQPARRWSAARHHHRHERGAGRLRRSN